MSMQLKKRCYKFVEVYDYSAYEIQMQKDVWKVDVV
jgi:hypothetical protein